MKQNRLSRPEHEKKPYVIILSVIGIIIGAAVGYFISAGFVSIVLMILCTAGGAVIGGAIGGFLGERLHERSSEKK